MKTGAYGHVLVIGADACSRMLNWEDRATCVLFGDGASAVLLSRNENQRLVFSLILPEPTVGVCSLWICWWFDRP